MSNYNYTLKNGSGAALLLFFIGLFSLTQINIGGKIGISELVMVICSPFVFVLNLKVFRRDRALTYFYLILLWLGGAIFVDLYTHNYFAFMMRGIAVPITVFANSVCIYAVLRKDLDNLKWFLLGVAISGVISIFVFQRGVAGDLAAEYGMEAGIESVVGYKLFWVNQLTAWLTLPIAGWYLKTPKVYSVVALGFLSAFNLATGGRSAFLIAATSLVLIVLGGKTRKALQFFKRHAAVVVIIIGMLGVGAKVVYQLAATSGWMGYDEADKYERSVEHGTSALDLLKESRSEFFIGLYAALDKPILGHGSVAIDNHGYVMDYMYKNRDLAAYERVCRLRNMFGANVIPAHSQIITFWMWHGIFGLIFWSFVIVMSIKTLAKRLYIYPPWFGYLAVTIPSFIWNVLFSPFGGRMVESALFVVLLLVSKMSREQPHEA